MAASLVEHVSCRFTPRGGEQAESGHRTSVSHPTPKPSREERGWKTCASKGDVCLFLEACTCSPWILEVSHGEGGIALSFRDCDLQAGCPRRQSPQDGTGGAAVVDFQRLRCNTTSCLLFSCCFWHVAVLFCTFSLRPFFLSPIGIVHGPTRRSSPTFRGVQKCQTAWPRTLKWGTA